MQGTRKRVVRIYCFESSLPFALGIKAALDEIDLNKGILYDNLVVDACLRLFREETNHGIISNNNFKKEAGRKISIKEVF